MFSKHDQNMTLKTRVAGSLTQDSCVAEQNLEYLGLLGAHLLMVLHLITYSEKLAVCGSVLQAMSPNVNLPQNTVNVSSQPNY